MSRKHAYNDERVAGQTGVQASPASASEACTPVAIIRLRDITMNIGLHKLRPPYQ